MTVDQSKLSFFGSLNYILQVWKDKESGELCTVDQYQPRKNRVWHGEMTLEEVTPQIEETIERMKIAITHFEEFLAGTRDHVYYWENENEPYLKK